MCNLNTGTSNCRQCLAIQSVYHMRLHGISICSHYSGCTRTDLSTVCVYRPIRGQNQQLSQCKAKLPARVSLLWHTACRWRGRPARRFHSQPSWPRPLIHLASDEVLDGETCVHQVAILLTATSATTSTQTTGPKPFSSSSCHDRAPPHARPTASLLPRSRAPPPRPARPGAASSRSSGPSRPRPPRRRPVPPLPGSCARGAGRRARPRPRRPPRPGSLQALPPAPPFSSSSDHVRPRVALAPSFPRRLPRRPYCYSRRRWSEQMYGVFLKRRRWTEKAV